MRRRVTRRDVADAVFVGGAGRQRASSGHPLGLGERVSLLTLDNNVAEVYAASDVATLVSSAEGLGVSAIEALATGLPVLVAPNGGLVEVVEDEISGLYLHDQTVDGTAAALIRLALDTGLRHRLGKAALARAKDVFEIGVGAAKTIAYYDELLLQRT